MADGLGGGWGLNLSFSKSNYNEKLKLNVGEHTIKWVHLIVIVHIIIYKIVQYIIHRFQNENLDDIIINIKG